MMVVLACIRCCRVKKEEKEEELDAKKGDGDNKNPLYLANISLCVFESFDRTSASRCGVIAQDTGVRPSSCLPQKAPAVVLTW